MYVPRPTATIGARRTVQRAVAQAGARGRPTNALGQAGMALVARGVLSLVGPREFGSAGEP
jgi:hypothetical protein